MEGSNAQVVDYDYFLKAFRAVDDEAASLLFFDGHLAVLTDYGIENLNTARPSWLTDPNVYVINIYDKAGLVVGGLRIHIYTGTNELPIIDALFPDEPRIKEVFDATLPKGTAEVCGLWSSKRVFGRGLSPVVCMSSVVIVSLLNFDDFFCFSAPYTEKMIRGNGCIPFEGIGAKGRFNYPTEEFVSVVLYNPSISKLEFADPYIASRIRSLIENPVQFHDEPSPRGAVRVKFDLDIRK
jgi:hypothetical protein